MELSFTGLTSRWRRLDHVQRFSITALVAVLSCALVFGWLLRNTVHRIVRNSDESQTASFVRHVISTQFSETLFQSDEPIRDSTMGSRIMKALTLDEVFRVKIYDLDGRIIWSDEPELLGIRFPNTYLDLALQGEVSSVIEMPERDEHVFERGVFDQIMETYIPISEGGTVVGVVEIYRHPEKLFLEMQRATWLLWVTSIGGGALVYLIMMSVVRKVNTTQRRLENELRHSAEELIAEKSRLERIVNAMGAGLILVDSRSHIQWANKKAESWFGADETLVGARSLDRICGDSQGCEVCPFERNRQPSTFPIVCEHEAPNATGLTRVFQCITTPEPSIDARGSSGNYLQLILDVTESREVEAQLRQADKMSLVGQFAAGLAHQINNPIGILLTAITHLLGRESPGGTEGELKDDLEMMERQCRRVDQSVRSLLSFSRKSAGIREALDLCAILEEAAELTKPQMKRSAIALETQFSQVPGVILGDPSDVLQVAVNLIDNAIDAMPEGGNLWITLGSTPGEEGPELLFEVRDTGGGLPVEDTDLLFEPFYTTKEIGSGTGLGLAVSKRIVEAHGGKIRASNTSDGGALFVVSLPMAEAYRDA